MIIAQRYRKIVCSKFLNVLLGAASYVPTFFEGVWIFWRLDLEMLLVLREGGMKSEYWRLPRPSNFGKKRNILREFVSYDSEKQSEASMSRTRAQGPSRYCNVVTKLLAPPKYARKRTTLLILRQYVC